MKKEIIIKDCKIGDNHPVFIIAEMSANHNQNFDQAVKIIHAAKKAGADAVKLQTYTPDTITIDCNNDYFRIKGTIWEGKNLYKLYREAYTPWEWQPKLKKIAEDLGIICFSTPFDKTAVDFLEEMNVPAYKIASFEITDLPLIEYIASKGKPVIISAGIATLSDIEEAIKACSEKMGNDQIALLKCTSEYPAPIEEMNLKTIPNMAETFQTVVGLSDHTLGITVPIAAVALGAKIIEKHFILDRKLGGPDSAFSLETDEFQSMVSSIREVEKALGEITYDLSDKIRRSRKFARSLFVVQDVKHGEVFNEKNVRSIRPGQGLHPRYLKYVLSKKASTDIKNGTPLSWDLIQ
jgi:pseudaminic acid synthase